MSVSYDCTYMFLLVSDASSCPVVMCVPADL
uniref:Uncharacterized protein n=1 Tax=Arundo donax TaxID=35708 RepID=A0A0A9GGK3_ARUDO